MEAAKVGCIPIAPHVYLTQFLDDTIPAERDIGLKMGLELLGLCDEVWVYGEPSEGMRSEIQAAWLENIPVVRKGNA